MMLTLMNWIFFLIRDYVKKYKLAPVITNSGSAAGGAEVGRIILNHLPIDYLASMPVDAYNVHVAMHFYCIFVFMI